MATITPTITHEAGHKILVQWDNVTESDTCTGFKCLGLYQDISIEADDTSAWGGATFTVVGDNGGGGATCRAVGTGSTSWTTNAIFSIVERPDTITPTFTGGSSQSVTVYMICWEEPS